MNTEVLSGSRDVTCVDCKHHVWVDRDQFCQAPQLVPLLELGNTITACDGARGWKSNCGVVGRWFEPQ